MLRNIRKASLCMALGLLIPNTVNAQVVPTAGVSNLANNYNDRKLYEMTEDDIAEEEYYDELELLALCVMAEAGNQDLTGKRMVVDVVLNRVDDPDYPNTITEVITQPYQFSSYWNGAIETVDPTDECFKAVTMELEERSYPGLLYFTAGRYNDSGTPWKKVGDHYFSMK